jgi:DNA-binding NarL/FixJ family response regulator
MRGVATRMAPSFRGCDDRGMRRVLIVDDHVGFRLRARALLETDGFDVVGEAGTGAEALAAATELRPDLVLLDVQLPDFDGFEVARRLEELDAEVEVVLISSRDRSDYGSLISESPARGFVPKGELSGAAIVALLR